jgi:hypothetical protein
MSVHVPCPWKIPIIRTLTKSYDPSSRIVNVTQSFPCTRGVAFNIPAHFPAALLNAETETEVDGGGGSGDAFVAKITTNVPFAAFAAKSEIELGHRVNHDAFEVKAALTLGPDVSPENDGSLKLE